MRQWSNGTSGVFAISGTLGRFNREVRRGVHRFEEKDYGGKTPVAAVWLFLY